MWTLLSFELLLYDLDFLFGEVNGKLPMGRHGDAVNLEHLAPGCHLQHRCEARRLLGIPARQLAGMNDIGKPAVPVDVAPHADELRSAKIAG